MDLKLETINPLEFEGWDKLLLSSQSYSFFHTTAWAKVLCESYHYKPVYFCAIHDDKLAVLIPFMEVNSFLTGRRGVSLPFSDHCELIIHDKNQFKDIFMGIIDRGLEYGWKFLELKDGMDSLANTIPFSSFWRHTLSLSDDIDRIAANFRNSTRSNVKKALKSGVAVQFCNSLQSIKEYYHLHCMTRKLHGMPPQPFYFFENIHRHVISKNLGFVILAQFNNRIIAGAIYFHFGEKCIYKYGASDRKYQSLRANNLVVWEAIQWYAENGYKTLCFGRTEQANNGLRQFKNGWGVTEHYINYYKYDLSNNKFLKSTTGKTDWFQLISKRLPIVILKAIGTVLYKHMG